MKPLKTVGLLVRALVGLTLIPLASAAVLLSDDFDDNSLDPAKWLADTSLTDPYGVPMLVEQNQRLEITARGYLHSRSQFVPSTASGVHISGTWRFLSLGPGDVVWVITRSSGARTSYPSGSGEITAGIGFRVYPPSYIDIVGNGGALIAGLTYGPNTLNLGQGDAVAFSVVDDGSNLLFRVTKVGDPTSFATASATCSTAFATNKISFCNREYSSNVVALDDVLVESVAPTELGVQVAAVQVRWTTDNFRSYQLQYSSALTMNTWVNLGAPVAGTGAPASYVDMILGEPQRFYRVVPLP